MAAGAVPAGVAVRDAGGDDARAIAEVHVASWRAAYRGLLPAVVLDGLSAGGLAARWARLVADDRLCVAVAVANGRVAGFAEVGLGTDADVGPTTGELITLYVEPALWGTGVGRALHDAGLDRLVERGCDRAVVWVLSTNERARHFYVHQGWRRDGRLRLQQFGGSVVMDHRLVRAVGPG